MILDTLTKLEAVLAGAVSANQPEVHVDYVDWNKSGVMTNPAPFRVALNNNTDVTILAAPVQNPIREVLRIDLYNKDTASVTVTVKSDDGTTERIMCKVVLLTLESLHFEKDRGWYALDANGNIKETVSTVSSSTLLGTTTNDNAAAGRVGEYISSTVVAGTTGLTTGTAANVTSISLTAGDWDVSGNVTFNYDVTTTVSVAVGSASTTSATDGPVAAQTRIWWNPGVVPSTTTYIPLPTHRISIAATTTVYLVSTLAFAISTAGAGGTIRARRIR